MIRTLNSIFILWNVLQMSKLLCNVLKFSGGEIAPNAPLVARLVFDEVVSSFRWNIHRRMARRQNDRTSTEITSREFLFCSRYAERLARLKQVPIFKVFVRPGRYSNYAPPDTKRALQRLGHVFGVLCSK